MKNKKLFEELEKINQENYKKFIESLNSHDLEILTVTFITKLNNELIEEFELNDDISFSCEITPEKGKMEYYYKGLKVEPDCYYLRPDNYREVSTLEILQECIKQDTHEPDIKKIEVE